MPVGFYSINTAGTIQVDENYQNMFVRANGTNTDPPLITNVTNPLCAIQCTDFASVFGQTDSSEINYDISRNGGTLKWWVFDTTLGPAGSFGCQIFKANSQLAFDALQKSMRIVDFRQFTSTAGWVGQSFTYPTGRQYAVILGGRSFRYLRTNEGKDSTPPHNIIREQFFYAAAKVVSNVVTYGWLRIHDETFLDENPTQVDRVRGNLQTLVIDVTNY